MANFLDEAPDVTEEILIPSKSKNKNSKNFLDSAPDLGEAKGESVKVEPSTFQKILNVVDIPGSMARAGVEAAISPEREILPALKEQALRTLESPTTAARTAPSGVDIGKAVFPEFKGESIPGQLAGALVETALDPLALIDPALNLMGKEQVGSKLAKPVLKMIGSESERQAAKAVAKYVSKTDALSEGVDAGVIGTRLVAENLQGLLKQPEKLYEKLAGQRHIQKLHPFSEDTLKIVRSKPKGGLISETSKDVTDMLKVVGEKHGINSPMPLEAVNAQLARNASLSTSKISGQTPDLAKIESILNKALKPTDTIVQKGENIFGNVKEPGTLELATGVIGKKPDINMPVASNMSLPDLQQLRKNIGKQVADRAFYAAPDENIKLETEVLKSAYRDLGDIIKSQLAGKEIRVGNQVLPADLFYEAQNNKLKTFMDLESMLEYMPTEVLKAPDTSAKIANVLGKATIGGIVGGGAALTGITNHPLTSMGLGALAGGGFSAVNTLTENFPEHLTSILSQAKKVGESPLTPAAASFGKSLFSEPSQFKGNRKPDSIQIDPRELIQWKIPANTQGMIENKDKVIAKLAQNDVPDDHINMIAEALNNPRKLSNVGTELVNMFPTLFEDSEYKTFDGKFADPNEQARYADALSKREDIDSITKFRMNKEAMKFNRVPVGV